MDVIDGYLIVTQFCLWIHNDEARTKILDQVQELVHHVFIPIPYVSEQVYEYDAVQASVRVIAYGDERAIRQHVQALGVPDAVVGVHFLQHASGEIGALLIAQVVINARKRLY